MKLLFFAFCLLSSLTARATVRGNVSLEESYEPLGALVRTSMRARLEKELTPFVSPYLAAGNESAAPYQYPLQLNTEAYLFAAPGVRLRLGDFSLLAETRFRKYHIDNYEGAPPRAMVDVQGLLIYENYWDHRLAETGGLSLFGAVYSETNFTSADNSNVIHTTLVRAGPEISFVKGGYLAAFVEPNFVVDRLHHYYNNRAELRFSGRVRYKADPFELNLTVSYLFNHYFKMKYLEEYPPPDRNQGFTAKLTLVVRY